MNTYPRPQFVRKDWKNLDGEWELNGFPIQVPYPPEAKASGYEGPKSTVMHYIKTFTYRSKKPKALLHFGAVDQICTVSLNGKYVGVHEGGYLPFEFEVGSLLKQGKNELHVDVIDKLSHDYPYGKQKENRGGMWYTPFSGIWKSVWLEPLPEDYIKSIKITPDLKGVTLDIDGKIERIDVKKPILWTPENPKLYTHKVVRGEDEVTIYYALREIQIKNINGINRVCLNGKPIFLHGLLDQGYFPDGICTATHEQYEQDILQMKALGFNCLRKHIKIESEDYYYLCDKHGILVIQDMVNSGDYHFMKETALATVGLKFSDKSGTTGKFKEFWMTHAKDTLKALYNHPCIIAYTIFNEGWGQFESDAMYAMLKAQDPTRLYDSTSGWFEQKLSDFDSKHIYFRNVNLIPKNRPMLLSEFGGYSYPVPGHLTTKGSYGYGACKSSEDLTGKIEKSYNKMVIPAIKKGLCGSIYTQVSDIEDEINGMITYDREVVKVDKERMLKIAEKIKEETEKI